MAKIRISAYTDKISVKAGDTLSVMASAEGTDSVHAALVRLIHGDEHPDGPGFIEEKVASPVERDWPVRKQYVQKGNFLRVADPKGQLAVAGAVTLHAYIFPTMPNDGRQAILGRWSVDGTRGCALGIGASGRLEFWVGDGTAADSVTAEVPLIARVWYFVAASFDPATRTATIYQEPVINRYNSLLSKIVPYDYRSHVSQVLRVRPAHGPDTPFLIGGASDHNPSRGGFVSALYSGKIDRCGVQAAVLDRAALDAIRNGVRPPEAGFLAYWDTTEGYTDRGIGDEVRDTGPHALHAVGINRPVRCQTGWNWAGRNDCFRLAPKEFGGIEFHNDALTDCHWQPTLTLDIPADLKSGVYAVKLTAGDGQSAAEEYTTFFVRAATPRAPICLLMPTASYLAYANFQGAFDGAFLQSITAVTPVFAEVDIEVYKNDVEFGLSTYDTHNDGSGVCHSSYHRPLFNMRPKYRFTGVGGVWQFPADLSIVAWLEHMKYDYEILTDEDLHRDGVAALKPYSMVLNATHCEYYSEPMMDATEDYLAGGGRLLYLSGNGYYWVVGFRPDEPWVMEVRKLEAGSRAWQARAGEHYLASTGERSGLWRHRNRAPQKLVGTGFSSEGMDGSVPYRRMPDGYHRSVSWIFAGVEGEVFGDFGLAGGGAAGIEIDRYDLAQGTPPHARILASSEPFTDNYPLVQEDIMFMTPGLGGTQHPWVRADMTYFTTPEHGAVFSASSIAWGSALPCHKFDNSVSRIMKNVVDAFLKPGLLPGSEFDAK
ncbi:MAG: LamG domain-containing protein [Alphaproteobacteria bacterium]|nr:LamG domain-containing protein [Alphaproteobacteria bacterium]